MGEAKRRKQLDPSYGQEVDKSKLIVRFGKFIDSSEVLSIFPNQIEEAGIKDSGKCIAFSIGDFKFDGVAFPSVDEKGSICVDTIYFTAESRLSEAEAHDIISLIEPEVIKFVAESYKSKFIEVRD